MLTAGVVLLILGLLLPVPLLVTAGVILIIVGVVLLLAGAAGRPVGGRRWY